MAKRIYNYVFKKERILTPRQLQKVVIKLLIENKSLPPFEILYGMLQNSIFIQGIKRSLEDMNYEVDKSEIVEALDRIYFGTQYKNKIKFLSERTKANIAYAVQEHKDLIEISKKNTKT